MVRHALQQKARHPELNGKQKLDLTGKKNRKTNREREGYLQGIGRMNMVKNTLYRSFEEPKTEKKQISNARKIKPVVLLLDHSKHY